MASGGMHLSKEFFELLKAIGESKSKQEEDRIVSREVSRLKQKLEPAVSASSSSAAGGGNSPAVPNSMWSSKKRTKEFLVRILYIEMLGHDGSFGYIKAVELAASSSLFHKRTGYLVCAACLPPDHEFRFMLVNQMQRDLQSPNVLECSGGLIACISIITSDMVPAVSNEVTKLLGHESATIRKKAIIALHRFHQLAPEAVLDTELQDHLRKLLCDKDPSVMGSSLNVMEALSLTNPVPFKDLVPSLVSILKQIGEHRLPSEYDYHRVPAPWMQIRLVRILGILGRADASVSSGMYEILSDSMKKADTGINCGYAIVYVCFLLSVLYLWCICVLCILLWCIFVLLFCPLYLVCFCLFDSQCPDAVPFRSNDTEYQPTLLYPTLQSYCTIHYIPQLRMHQDHCQYLPQQLIVGNGRGGH
jgi:AP-4 complex subunit epsilon-1